MTCKRSEQCDHADICRFAKSDDYHLLGGSCFEPKDPQTNEEWMHTLNTEQLAEWIAKIVDCDCCPVKRKFCDDNPCKIRFAEWLKQPHSGES